MSLSSIPCHWVQPRQKIYITWLNTRNCTSQLEDDGFKRRFGKNWIIGSLVWLEVGGKSFTPRMITTCSHDLSHFEMFPSKSVIFIAINDHHHRRPTKFTYFLPISFHFYVAFHSLRKIKKNKVSSHWCFTWFTHTQVSVIVWFMCTTHFAPKKK